MVDNKLLFLTLVALVANMWVQASPYREPLIITAQEFPSLPTHNGTLIPTRNEQCINQGLDATCDFEGPDGNIIYGCLQLRCAKKWSDNGIWRVIYAGEPVDGTYCGPSMYCQGRECIRGDKSVRYTSPEPQRASNCN